MSLFAISDLHLSIGSGPKKSMEVFGSRWNDYINKLAKNWRAVITPKDSVVIAGDISWALRLEEAREDLLFIDSLPGTKYIGKGNHDFWWSTAAKMQKLFDDSGISTLKILYNNAYETENMIICGSRGWFTDKTLQKTVGDVEYEKIINREAVRLRLALDEALRLRGDTDREILVFLHFPPVYREFSCPEIISLLHEYGIKRCFYGHIHGSYTIPRSFECEGIEMIMTAADFLDFAALPILPS